MRTRCTRYHNRTTKYVLYVLKQYSYLRTRTYWTYHLAESRGKLIGTSPYFVLHRHVVVRCIPKAALATVHRVQLPDVVHTQVVTVSGSVYLIAAMPWCVLALLTPTVWGTCPVSLAAEAVPTCGGSNIVRWVLVRNMQRTEVIPVDI
jgi:hypothetical protein